MTRYYCWVCDERRLAVPTGDIPCGWSRWLRGRKTTARTQVATCPACSAVMRLRLARARPIPYTTGIDHLG